MTKLKTAFVDLHSPMGHLNYINFYIKNLKNIINIIILNSNVKKILKYQNAFYLNYETRIISKILSLFRLYKILVHQKIDQVIFYGYDPLYFYFFVRLLIKKDIKVYVVEHDTLNTNKFIRIFFNKFIDKKIIRLVYNQEKKNFIKNEFNMKSTIINLPILKDLEVVEKMYSENSKKFTKFLLNTKHIKILIPTRYYVDKKSLYSFIKKNQKGTYFIALSKKINFEFNNLIKLKNFKSKILKNIDFIYLANDNKLYNTRVSSWLYTSIAYNKKIILEKSITCNYEKKRFPKFIIESKNFKPIVPKNLKKKIHEKFVFKFDQKIITDMENILS